MRLLPTTLLTMDDWIVDVDYIRNGQAFHKCAGVSPHKTEEEALWCVAMSLRKRGIFPEFKDMKARRRRDHPRWASKSTERHPLMIERFVTGAI